MNVSDGVTDPIRHSSIQTFKHSNIQALRYSGIQVLVTKFIMVQRTQHHSDDLLLQSTTNSQSQSIQLNKPSSIFLIVN